MTIDKWSSLDYGRTAHWWLGNEGTACGLDFRVDIRQARFGDQLCRECLDALGGDPMTTTRTTETESTEVSA